jgi:hypothetical protein
MALDQIAAATVRAQAADEVGILTISTTPSFPAKWSCSVVFEAAEPLEPHAMKAPPRGRTRDCSTRSGWPAVFGKLRDYWSCC